MILDLLALTTILTDFLSLSFNSLFIPSLSTLVLVPASLLLLYILWRSTDTPHDIPVAPVQPFRLSLPSQNNGRRHTLQDVRLNAHFSAPRPAPLLPPQPAPEPSPPLVGSVFTRLFRSRQGYLGPTRPHRPFLRSRFQSPPNFFAYHRLFHRHHHRQEDPASASPPTPPRARSLSESDISLHPLGPSTMSPERQEPEGSGAELRFTLKFLNDTHREIVTQDSDKIGDFKRREFGSELGENKVVRLIFNGRVLDNESKTLKESGIFDQCVVHCLIVTPQPTGGESGSGSRSGRSRNGARGPEPGLFFVSFMGIILLFLWFICFNFGQQLFTQSAVVSLSVLTAIFLIGLVAFYLPVHPANFT